METSARLKGLNIIWSPTMRCNCHCQHCFIEKGNFKGKELDLWQAREIFAQFSGCKIEITGGEPFVRDDMVQIVKDLLNLDIEVGIATNGAYPREIEKVARLHSDRVYFALSLDALGQKHEQIRHCPGLWSRVEETISILIRENQAFQTTTVIQPSNFQDLKYIANYFPLELAEVERKFLPFFCGPRSGYLFNQENIDACRQYQNAFSMELIEKYWRGWRIGDCSAGERGFYIAPDGRVHACYTMAEVEGSDQFLLGDLKEDSVRDILDSKRAFHVRQLVKQCPGCFNGCELTREGYE